MLLLQLCLRQAVVRPPPCPHSCSVSAMHAFTCKLQLWLSWSQPFPVCIFFFSAVCIPGVIFWNVLLYSMSQSCMLTARGFGSKADICHHVRRSHHNHDLIYSVHVFTSVDGTTEQCVCVCVCGQILLHGGTFWLIPKPIFDKPINQCVFVLPFWSLGRLYGTISNLFFFFFFLH